MTLVWPTFNASLNLLSAIFLTLGFVMIKQKNPKKHRYLMISAFITSMIFLISYLLYHWRVGSVKFQDTGPIRIVYLSILISHSVLAAFVPFMAMRTIYLALKKRHSEHRSIARWTLPLWTYVSITGVIVYLMLYHWPKSPTL